MEFKTQIFQACDVMESGLGRGKWWKMDIRGSGKSCKITFGIPYAPRVKCGMHYCCSTNAGGIMRLVVYWPPRNHVHLLITPDDRKQQVVGTVA